MDVSTSRRSRAGKFLLVIGFAASPSLGAPAATVEPVLFPRRGEVTFRFSLDAPARVRLEYRKDGAWARAAAPAKEYGKGVGEITWDSRADLPKTSFAGMRVRVVPHGGAPAESDSFTLNNDRAAQLVTRYPYLQRAREGSVLLLWRTRLPEATRVRIGDRVVTHDGLRTSHEVELTGLAPRAEYAYTVLDRGGKPLTATERFRAPPRAGGGPVRFFVMGDMGSGFAQQHRLAHRLIERVDEADFGLFLGDLVYPNGEARLYDVRQFHVYRNVMKRVCVFVTMGNHDDRQPEGFRESWRLFENGPAPGTYSFDFGPVHLVSVDTADAVRKGDLAWLDRDLAESRARLEIVFQHRPLYSARSDPEKTSRRREPQARVLERHDVALFLAGHDHLYARTTPRRDYDAPGSGRPGVVHVTSGGGGAFLYFQIGKDPAAAIHAHRYHFVWCEADGGRLTGAAIDLDGKVFDRFAIER